MASQVFPVLLFTLISSVYSDTDIAHILTEGTWRMCLDKTMCKEEPPHCPQDRIDCCRSCLSQCDTKGGDEIVDIDVYEKLECNISHDILNDWSNITSPFILPVFEEREAEELITWQLFEVSKCVYLYMFMLSISFMFSLSNTHCHPTLYTYIPSLFFNK